MMNSGGWLEGISELQRSFGGELLSVSNVGMRGLITGGKCVWSFETPSALISKADESLITKYGDQSKIVSQSGGEGGNFRCWKSR